MKVSKQKDGLLIMPETEFEEEVLCEMFPSNENSKHTVFMKLGMTASEIVGLKILAQDKPLARR